MKREVQFDIDAPEFSMAKMALNRMMQGLLAAIMRAEFEEWRNRNPQLVKIVHEAEERLEAEGNREMMEETGDEKCI